MFLFSKLFPGLTETSTEEGCPVAEVSGWLFGMSPGRPRLLGTSEAILQPRPAGAVTAPDGHRGDDF